MPLELDRTGVLSRKTQLCSQRNEPQTAHASEPIAARSRSASLSRLRSHAIRSLPARLGGCRLADPPIHRAKRPGATARGPERPLSETMPAARLESVSLIAKNVTGRCERS